MFHTQHVRPCAKLGTVLSITRQTESGRQRCLTLSALNLSPLTSPEAEHPTSRNPQPSRREAQSTPVIKGPKYPNNAYYSGPTILHILEPTGAQSIPYKYAWTLNLCLAAHLRTMGAAQPPPAGPEPGLGGFRALRYLVLGSYSTIVEESHAGILVSTVPLVEGWKKQNTHLLDGLNPAFV